MSPSRPESAGRPGIKSGHGRRFARHRYPGSRSAAEGGQCQLHPLTVDLQDDIPLLYYSAPPVRQRGFDAHRTAPIAHPCRRSKALPDRVRRESPALRKGGLFPQHQVGQQTADGPAGAEISAPGSADLNVTTKLFFSARAHAMRFSSIDSVQRDGKTKIIPGVTGLRRRGAMLDAMLKLRWN